MTGKQLRLDVDPEPRGFNRLQGKPADRPHFHGDAEAAGGENRSRLSAQLQRVWDLMRDGERRTLHAISRQCLCSEPSASARLRDLRKVEIMGPDAVDVIKEPAQTPGVYFYRVVPRQGDK